MQPRQLAELEHGGLVEGQRIDGVERPLVGDEALGGLGERELREGMLDGDLPHRDRAQVDLVIGIGEGPPG